MTAVGTKTRKSFGFADVSKQISQSPYTRISAILSRFSGFFSFSVTDVCHSRDKNTTEIIQKLLLSKYYAFNHWRSLDAFTAMYFAGGISVTGL